MMRSYCAMVYLSCAAVACGPANSLEGSISESFPLDFDAVQIRKQGADLIIEYMKNIGGGSDKVCKIVVNTRDLKITDDSNLTGQTFLDRVSISRVTSTGGDFPVKRGGKIHFDVFKFESGGKIDGHFDTLFENGRTLYGNFEDDRLEVVDQS